MLYYNTNVLNFGVYSVIITLEMLDFISEAVIALLCQDVPVARGFRPSKVGLLGAHKQMPRWPDALTADLQIVSWGGCHWPYWLNILKGNQLSTTQ